MNERVNICRESTCRRWTKFSVRVCVNELCAVARKKKMGCVGGLARTTIIPQHESILNFTFHRHTDMICWYRCEKIYTRMIDARDFVRPNYSFIHEEHPENSNRTLLFFNLLYSCSCTVENPGISVRFAFFLAKTFFVGATASSCVYIKIPAV